jgi:DNA ligase-1
MTAFGELAALGRRLERLRGRLDKQREVAAFLRSLDAEEVPLAVAFLAGRPFATSDPRVLGVRGLGRGGPDGGAPMPPLTLNDVADAFGQVAAAAGAGSRRARDARLAELSARASSDEHEFLNRIIGGEMRTGVSEGLLLEAIAAAWSAAVSRATVCSPPNSTVDRISTVSSARSPAA